MRILALETSGTGGGVALFQDSNLLGELELPPPARSAASLAPAISTLLATHQVPPSQIGLVAVTVGPGSFTGLRVGITTARFFAYAAGAQVLGVNTLAAIAESAPQVDEGKRLSVVIDAQR